MGLDGVEILLSVEETFKIHITDEEAVKTLTVGDLQNLVVSKLQGPDKNACLTSAAFYRLRRGIIDALGVDRKLINPSTPLNDIFPRNDRRERWQRVQDAMNLKMPDLQHPVSITCLFFVFGQILAAVFGWYCGFNMGFAWLIAIIVGSILGNFFLVLTPMLAIEFRNAETVGDLTKAVLAMNYSKLAQDNRGWSQKDILEILKRIIAEQIPLSPEKIKPESRFVEDLGVS